MGNVEKMDTRKMCPKRGKVTPNANEFSILFTNEQRGVLQFSTNFIRLFFSFFKRGHRVIIIYTERYIFAITILDNATTLEEVLKPKGRE